VKISRKIYLCAITYPVDLDTASLLRRVSVLLHTTWLWITPFCSGGFQCCHMSHGFGPRLLIREGSDVTMCYTALEPTSLLERALMLPRAPQLRTLSPCSGGFRCCHVSRDPQRPVNLKNKEMLSWPTYAVRPACFQGAPACL
jgi:hypothetical protein